MPDLTRSGYKLTGWKDSGGIVHPVGEEYSYTSDVTLTAEWRQTVYTVKYYKNDSTNDSRDISCDVDQQSCYIGNYTRTGYTFSGHSTSSSGGTVVNSEWYSKASTVKGGDAVNIYARWTANTYTLTYDNNGGSGCSTKTGTYRSTWGTLCTPSGNFFGWYTTKQGSSSLPSTNSGRVTNLGKATKDEKLYAWYITTTNHTHKYGDKIGQRPTGVPNNFVNYKAGTYHVSSNHTKLNMTCSHTHYANPGVKAANWQCVICGHVETTKYWCPNEASSYVSGVTGKV